jgi:hypothetical protein
MKRLIITFMVFLSINTHAQDTAVYKPGVLYKQGKNWRLDGRKLKPKEIRTEINTVTAAAAFNKKAGTLETIGVICSAAGLACLLLNPRKIGRYPYRKDNGLTLPAVGFYGSGFYFYFRSIHLRKKAVKAYFEHHKLIY